MRRHQGAKVEHFDVSNVIYHKFSHGAVSYTRNGENVNIMLELSIKGEGWSIANWLMSLLAVPRRLFCFGSLVVLDVVCGYVLLFVLDIKIENR